MTAQMVLLFLAVGFLTPPDGTPLQILERGLRRAVVLED
jgi:hypothetical protein